MPTTQQQIESEETGVDRSCSKLFLCDSCTHFEICSGFCADRSCSKLFLRRFLLWTINKRQLPLEIPFSHCMIFSSDSSRLLLPGKDRRIYAVNAGSAKVVHVFTPCSKDDVDELPPCEPPITKMFTSIDDQWLAAINCFGDLYIFNLETLRQHWFLSRLDRASYGWWFYTSKQ